MSSRRARPADGPTSDQPSASATHTIDTFAERYGYEVQRLPRLVADAIRATMRASDTSQRDLARIIGVSESRISQVLAGNENLTLRTLAAVCAGLGCHANFAVSASPGELQERVKRAAAEAVTATRVVETAEDPQQAATTVAEAVLEVVAAEVGYAVSARG